jgi:hypothetical protein
MNGRVEEELRRALNRAEPPDGFADRVMARIPERQRAGSQGWWYAVLAALLALLTVFTTQRISEQRRERAHETERQVVFALALAAEKLDHVNEKLQSSAPDLRIHVKQEKRYE